MVIKKYYSVVSTEYIKYLFVNKLVYNLHLSYNLMADREENVYRAKLAEQAERYDGKKKLMLLQRSFQSY